MPFVFRTDGSRPGAVYWDDVWPEEVWPKDYARAGTRHGVDPNIPGPVPYKMRKGKLLPGGMLPDIMEGRWSSGLFLSRRVRKLIEANDWVQHYFIPLDFTLKDGSEVKGQYFQFIAGDLTDGVVAEASNVSPEYINDKLAYYYYPPSSPEISWRPEAIQGRAIWKDRYLPLEFFISDFLEAELRRLHIKYYRTHPSAVWIG